MAFVTGLMLIDAPASALNNLGQAEGTFTDNTVAVKAIRTREGMFPYVSAQAFRYWLRRTLEEGSWGWQAAPIFREAKIAYTDANPILYWDDDLFGYMRAPSKKESAASARQADTTRAGETPTTETLTRVSPFRTSTLVSIAPVILTNDFGVMSRHEGDPVLHEHQFYRTTLQGLFSLDLRACGVFTYRDKTGYLNLDKVRTEQAKTAGLQHLSNEKAYRLSNNERLTRIKALLAALSQLQGGAKQALHYTDVSPDLVVAAVTKGGNHIFGHVVGADPKGRPVVRVEALSQALTIFGEDILSSIYVGWVNGFMEEEQAHFEKALETDETLKQWRGEESKKKIIIAHPKEALSGLARELENNSDWLN